jgi:nicotinate dehydrogenase subunit B
VVVGQDNGLTINPAGVQHQIHGNVIQSVSRTLKERVEFDERAVASREWGGYPILTFPEVPVIQVVLAPRPDQPPLGAGESASVPSAAAIANAIYDATGLRLREPPFTPDRVRSALLAAKGGGEAEAPRRRGLRRWLPPIVAGALGLWAALWPWRPAIAPIAAPDPGLYSAETIARGRQLAALGDCAVCHTQEGGVENAGGRPLETPFGVVYATNITPDPETGIGGWSFPAFERAMREGVHRDGRRLYPAFPYTAFTRTTEADLQALYAYLMSQPPVRASAPPTRLNFPFNLRPLMAGWNILFLRPGAYRPDASKSEAWNRGAYLVEGLGHCGACHSPRNLLGAEKRGASLYAGGFAEGWEAPPLTSLSHAPVPWTEADLFTYLRTGFSERHGVAGGPMGPVVAGLAEAPDADIRAMAAYLASFNATISPQEAEARAQALEARAQARNLQASEAGARIYQAACAVCHDPAANELFGVKPSLALNTNLHSAVPDNLLRAVLDGVATPGKGELGAMPGFRDSLNDQQLADLLAYLRTQFAADKPPWPNLKTSAARVRGGPAHR